MTRMVSFIVLVAAIVVIGLIFYRVMSIFILPLFLAALLVVIFHPLHRWMLVKCKGRQRLSAGLTTAAVLLIVLAPAVWVVSLAVIEGLSIATHSNVDRTTSRLIELRESVGLEMPLQEELRQVEESLGSLRSNLSVDFKPDSQASETAGILHRLDQLVEALSEKKSDQGQASALLQTHVKQLQAALQAQGLQSSAVSADPLALAVEKVLAAEDASAQDYSPARYHEAVRRAGIEFHDFKMALLGGPYLAWVKQQANPSDEELKVISSQIALQLKDWLLSISSATTAFLGKLGLSLIIMVVALYFFFADGPVMISSFMRLSPLDDSHERELLEEFDRVSRAVVVATLLSAVVQGLLAGFGYYLAGLESVFLLMLLTMVFAMIPVLGTGLVWIPACLWLYLFEGRPLAAMLLAAYGAGIVSMADNVIKPMVLHGQSNLHPLLALLSVLGGVQALGPIGVLVGPMVVVFLQTLLNILHRELMAMEQRGKTA